MSEKPCYCLGKNTILQVATEGQLQTDLVDFVAADDLFHQDPYVQIFQLTKERDQLAAQKKVLLETVTRQINGFDIDEYIRTQFPATVGHVPIKIWFDNIKQALEACGK